MGERRVLAELQQAQLVNTPGNVRDSPGGVSRQSASWYSCNSTGEVCDVQHTSLDADASACLTQPPADINALAMSTEVVIQSSTSSNEVSGVQVVDPTVIQSSTSCNEASDVQVLDPTAIQSSTSSNETSTVQVVDPTVIQSSTTSNEASCVQMSEPIIIQSSTSANEASGVQVVDPAGIQTSTSSKGAIDPIAVPVDHGRDEAIQNKEQMANTCQQRRGRNVSFLEAFASRRNSNFRWKVLL